MVDYLKLIIFSLIASTLDSKNKWLRNISLTLTKVVRLLLGCEFNHVVKRKEKGWAWFAPYWSQVASPKHITIGTLSGTVGVFTNGSHKLIVMQVVVHPWRKVDRISLAIFGGLIGWRTSTPCSVVSSPVVCFCEAAIVDSSLFDLSNSNPSRRRV